MDIVDSKISSDDDLDSESDASPNLNAAVNSEISLENNSDLDRETDSDFDSESVTTQDDERVLSFLTYFVNTNFDEVSEVNEVKKKDEKREKEKQRFSNCTIEYLEMLIKTAKGDPEDCSEELSEQLSEMISILEELIKEKRENIFEKGARQESIKRKIEILECESLLQEDPDLSEDERAEIQKKIKAKIKQEEQEKRSKVQQAIKCLREARNIIKKLIKEEQSKKAKKGTLSKKKTEEVLKKEELKSQLENLLDFAKGIHPYYRIDKKGKEAPATISLVVGEEHDDGISREVFETMAETLASELEGMNQSKDGVNFPVLRLYLEANLAMHTPAGIRRGVKGGIYTRESKVTYNSNRHMHHLLHLSRYEYAENEGFYGETNPFQKYDVNEPVGGCLRLLSANYEIIYTITKAKEEYKKNDFPFYFFLLCGLSHAECIARMLNVKPIMPIRVKEPMTPEEKEGHFFWHRVHPIRSLTVCQVHIKKASSEIADNTHIDYFIGELKNDIKWNYEEALDEIKNLRLPGGNRRSKESIECQK